MKKISRMKWMTCLSLTLAVVSLTLTPLQAARNDCATAVDVEMRDDVFDGVRSVNGPLYTEGAKIGCPNSGGDLTFVFSASRPLEFHHTAFGLVQSGGNLHVQLPEELGFTDPSFTDGSTRSTSKVQFSFVVNGEQRFLAFRSTFPPASGSTDITVTRVGDTWELEARPGTKAQLLKIVKGKYQPIGAPEEVLFKMTLRPKP